MKTAAPFVVVLVLGLLAGYFGRTLLAPADRSDADPGEGRRRAAAPSLELVQLREANRKLKEQLAEFEDATGEGAGADKPGTIARVDAEKRAEPFKLDLAEIMKRGRQQQEERDARRINLHVVNLAERLDLGEAQQKDLRSLMEAQAEAQRERIGKFMNVSTSKAGVNALDLDVDALDPRKQQEEFEQQLTALLSDEQRQAYADYQAEKRANQVEVMASRELASLQTMFDLSEEQKDAAFDAFTALALERVDGDGGATRFIGLGASREKRLAMLGDILTPAQMDVYEQSPQVQSMRMITGAGGGPGAVYTTSIAIDGPVGGNVLLPTAGASQVIDLGRDVEAAVQAIEVIEAPVRGTREGTPTAE